MLRKFAATVFLLAVACHSGGVASAPTSPRDVSPLPSHSVPAGLVVGELEPLPDYPTNVPQSVVNAVGVFPSQMRYAGQENVQGQERATITVVRFGEGHPAFSPTVLVGSPQQRIDVVIDNQTPVLHNFSTIDGQIDRNVATGKSITVILTFPGTGYLWFFCKYHLQDSQVGALETRP